MTLSRKHRGWKIAGIVLLFLLAAGGGVILSVSQHYKSIIRKKLPVIAAKATDSLYKVTAEHYSINIFNKSFSIHGLHLRPDPEVLERWRKEGRGPHTLLDIMIPEVEITGLKLNEMSGSKEITFSSIDLYHPKIDIVLTNDPGRKDTTRKERPKVERIFAANINIIDPYIRYKSGEDTAAYSVKSQGGLIAISDWEYRPLQPEDTTRFFYGAAADIRLERLTYHKPGSLYNYGMDTFHFRSLAHRLDIAGGYVKPVVNKTEFYEIEKQQKEIYEAIFPHISLNGFSWESLIRKRGILVDSIHLFEPDLEVYLSRIPPPNIHSRMGNYPHQLLQKVPLPLHIPVIKVEDGRFRYSEQNDKTHRVGTLDFNQIDGSVLKVTNLPAEISKQPHCTITLAGKFMHKSDISASFDFPLAAPHGAFGVKGLLEHLDAGQVSETAKALALAAVKSLKLHKLSFNITGNDTAADGQITIIYNDLRVKLQKVEAATKEMHSRGFLSLLANELLLYNDNPMEGEPLRVAITHVKRDSTKSFFNLIWRNMFDAGLQTAIRQEGAADLVRKSKAKKGKEKVHFFRKLFPKRKKNNTDRSFSFKR